ncbi:MULTISPECIES: hypothetical protein [unclassified Bradyrhizobium]
MAQFPLSLQACAGARGQNKNVNGAPGPIAKPNSLLKNPISSSAKQLAHLTRRLLSFSSFGLKLLVEREEFGEATPPSRTIISET